MTSDGAPVTVRVTPGHDGDSPVAILVERPGSMGDASSRDRMTKHESVVLGLPVPWLTRDKRGLRAGLGDDVRIRPIIKGYRT